jgi:hypothetical protein
MIINPQWLSKFELKPNSWVFVPTSQCKAYGLEIKRQIENRWTPPQNYFHLRHGGHVSALKSHLNRRFFLHIDVENFFSRIATNRISRNLRPYFGNEKAREIARNSTVRKPGTKDSEFILPFGFVQSPILASLCLYKSRLGSELVRLSKRQDLTVSVYVDDIIISAESKKYLSDILIELKILATKSGLNLNEEKQEGPAEKVTSFNVELSRNQLKVTDLRLIQFKIYLLNNQTESQCKGVLGYLDSINAEQSTKISQFIDNGFL